MKTILRFAIFICLALGGFIVFSGNSSKKRENLKEKDLTLGAYYFDGWTGNTWHVTKSLTDTFPEREPKWGWKTSTPDIIEAQIDEAADAGIDFFSFCWYYSKGTKEIFGDPKNQALALYLKSNNKNKLNFNLLVANHKGYEVGPKQWNIVSKEWLKLFHDKSYLKVDEKPLLIFFSFRDLIKSFGSPKAVNLAFDSLRTAAENDGLKGVTIATCITPDSDAFTQAKLCGFDIFTGYNYHNSGFKSGRKIVPIDSLITGSYKTWNDFKKETLPYIPVATLNWDPRPWENKNKEKKKPVFIYTGYCKETVYKSVLSLKKWVQENPKKVTKERIALLYAWNEYGEGAWLTPSKGEKEKLLDGVKKALLQESNN